MTRQRRSGPRRRSRRQLVDVGPRAGWLMIEDRWGDPIVQAPPPVTEQLRYIVERLRLQDTDGVPSRVGVTSALAGEGASMIARTLAGVLAGDSDITVCLVSLDWWTTATPETDQAGIAQVVTGERTTADVVQETSNESLSYVPAGWANPDLLPELVRSSVLSRTLKDLALRYHHIVLELPPVRVTSQALALAGHCDACALVVLQGSTTHSDVQTAIDNLGADRLLGVIMNQASSRVPDYLLRAVAPA